jgi:hypothetical protein
MRRLAMRFKSSKLIARLTVMALPWRPTLQSRP